MSGLIPIAYRGTTMNTRLLDAETQAELTLGERDVLLEQVEVGRVEADLRRYAAIHSRNVQHAGNDQAVRMLVADLEGIGGLRVSAPRFANGTLQNVEARLPVEGREDAEIVLVSAHLDSTAKREPGYLPVLDPAPGADDDASGIAGVLAAARAAVALEQASGGARVREIRFVLFNAEEQEQAGSRAYARALRDEVGARLVAVYQMDMIGYDPNGDGTFELHAGYSRDPDVERESLALARVVGDLAPQVSIGLDPQVYPGLATGKDNGQDFSDHASFHSEGYAACLVTEDFFPELANQGGEPNPRYHLEDDTSDVLSPAYAADIARAVAAAVWYKATRP
ncbi:MAG TPA: M28 family peptidase [Longimicrobium sp.]|nr:M28 family peptidase [Longimicrobium sp.]